MHSGDLDLLITKKLHVNLQILNIKLWQMVVNAKYNVNQTSNCNWKLANKSHIFSVQRTNYFQQLTASIFWI